LTGHTPVTICHKPGTPAEKTLIVDDSAVPGHLRHGDYLGPCGETSVTTTLTSPTTTTVPITETIPPTTITQPPETTTTEITVTVPVPPETTTVPATDTIVTLPPDSTTTVTLPGQTVTQPPVTNTHPDVTIERPPETVTLPGATTTVSAAGTTVVVTVTGPNQIVHPGIVVTKRVQAKVKKARLVPVAARVHRLRARVKFLARKVFVTVHHVAGVARGASACPPGSEPFNGACRPVVRGKG
jgi:hypothetical protein